VLSNIGNVMGVIVQCSIGGLSVGKDIAAYRKGVHAVVGTPGRILDLIRYRFLPFSPSPLLFMYIRRGNLSTELLKVLVVDEADEV
jgi:ATP-dependent RNA helicase